MSFLSIIDWHLTHVQDYTNDCFFQRCSFSNIFLFCLSKNRAVSYLNQESRVIFDIFSLMPHIQLMTKSSWFYLEIYMLSLSLTLHYCHQVWHYFSAGIQSPNWSVSMGNFKPTKQETVVRWAPMYLLAGCNHHQHKVVSISSIFTLCSPCFISFGLLWSKSMYQRSL